MVLNEVKKGFDCGISFEMEVTGFFFIYKNLEFEVSDMRIFFIEALSEAWLANFNSMRGWTIIKTYAL